MKPSAGRRFWLMKCEPAAYTIDDLERDGATSWEGVRNFQARNLMRDQMKAGDGVLFYASNADPSGVTGVAEIAREAYPDPFAWNRGHRYFDPKSDPKNPTWYSVEISFVERFPRLVPLAELKATRGLEKMMVVRKGSRLSVQPVAPDEFEIVLRLGRRRAGEARAATRNSAPRGGKAPRVGGKARSSARKAP